MTELYQNLLKEIETQLKKTLDTLDPASPLTAPVKDIISRGGKRWRPLLMLLTAQARAENNIGKVLPLVPLVEFSHNASLIHDDIEDKSPERRGKPTLHLLYGEDAAINAGSYLYFLAASAIEDWDAPPEAKARAYRSWAACMRALHQGQALDITWHNESLAAHVPAVEDYYRMCRGKTGALTSFAVELGGGGSELCTAAENLGLGFQILDDVKNLRGDVKGKTRGDDIVEGKRSLPLLLYLQDHSGDREGGTAFIEHCLKEAAEKGTSAPEVGECINALEASGAVETALQQGQGLVENARQAFFSAGGPTLAGLVDLLL